MIMWQTIKISCAQPLFVISTIARSTSCIIVIEALGKQNTVETWAVFIFSSWILLQLCFCACLH